MCPSPYWPASSCERLPARRRTPDLRVAIQLFPQVAGYEILEELGRGGVGVVYRAHDRRLNRTVALKLLLSGGHASAVQLRRFQVEAEAAARLQHRNIVQIHEIGEHEGRPYLVLQFVSGGNLADRYRGQPQPPRSSSALVEQLARTIDFAHQHGIVHRDLKPANVLLQGAQASGQWPHLIVWPVRIASGLCLSGIVLSHLQGAGKPQITWQASIARTGFRVESGTRQSDHPQEPAFPESVFCRRTIQS